MRVYTVLMWLEPLNGEWINGISSLPPPSPLSLHIEGQPIRLLSLLKLFESGVLVHVRERARGCVCEDVC